MKEMTKFIIKKNLFIFLVLFSSLSLMACSKDLSESVKQKQTRVQVGTDINPIDLFECEEGINLGFKNANSFNSKKIGSYSLDAIITDEKNQSEKTYLIEVYDDIPPEINASDIIFYENEDYDLLNNVTVSDNSGEEIAATISEQTVDKANPGEYIVKYSAKDSSGNESEKQITVTVKPKYTFSKLKKLAKEIIKNNSLDKLEVKTNEDKEVVWVCGKDTFDIATTETCVYYFNLEWALTIEDHEICNSILADAYLLDIYDYLKPENIYIKSDTEKIASDSNSHFYDLEYTGDGYAHKSFLQFLFTDKNKLDKSINIFNSDKIHMNLYTDKHTFKYKLNKKDKKIILQMVEFYNALNSIKKTP